MPAKPAPLSVTLADLQAFCKEFLACETGLELLSQVQGDGWADQIPLEDVADALRESDRMKLVWLQRMLGAASKNYFSPRKRGLREAGQRKRDRAYQEALERIEREFRARNNGWPLDQRDPNLWWAYTDARGKAWKDYVFGEVPELKARLRLWRMRKLVPVLKETY